MLGIAVVLLVCEVNEWVVVIFCYYLFAKYEIYLHDLIGLRIFVKISYITSCYQYLLLVYLVYY